MEKLTANKAKTHFGELLMKVQREPINVTKNGKSVAIVIATEEYKQLKLQALRSALIEGEESEDVEDFSIDAINDELDASI
jgi:prevent-host-death family protein